MNKYRVYYADDNDNHELSRMKYVIAQADNRLSALNWAYDNHKWVAIWGIIELREDDQLTLPVLIPAETPTPTPPAADTVQVSWWQDGARKGMFSQQAYPVIEREGEFVIVDLMGKPKGVKAEYTRKVAA